MFAFGATPTSLRPGCDDRRGSLTAAAREPPRRDEQQGRDGRTIGIRLQQQRSEVLDVFGDDPPARGRGRPEDLQVGLRAQIRICDDRDDIVAGRA
jgi:hypothetical protein